MIQAEREQLAFHSEKFAEISILYNDIGILTNLNVDVYTKNEIKVFFYYPLAQQSCGGI